MKTIVELTREAGGFEPTPEFLERLVELARADERKIVMSTPLTKEMWQRFEDEIRADEREALLDLVESYAKNNADLKSAIRERGETK
jgi:hypothetical protein